MRNISAASLAILQASTGVRPVIIVKVFWGDTTSVSYCDRIFQEEGLVGKLLSISGIEDIVDINQAASSVSLTVGLDDSDGSIKNIFDYNDIHKKYVIIYQWFQGLPINEAFPIFEGEIATPLSWTEGARTLNFTVLTKLQSTEVGFSIEEGKFPLFPVSLIGQAWPVVFGHVNGVKMLKITDPPSAVLASGFGIVNELVWQAELADLNKAYALAIANEQLANQLSLNNARIAGAFKPFGGSLPDNPETAQQYDNAAAAYHAQAIQYAEERIKLDFELQNRESIYELEKSLQFRVLPIVSSNLPTGVPLKVEIGDYTADATVIGNQISLTNLIEKLSINIHIGTNEYDFGKKITKYIRANKGQKFIWIDGGTTIRIFELARYYIASLGAVNVVNVWAETKYGRAVVPKGLYTVKIVNFNGMIVTQVIFPTPLTSHPGEWVDGDITFDCESDIPANAIDIMLWAINGYSNLSYDVESFNYVREKVAPFPMNFALSSRPDIVQFLQDIAFQARCAIWINDRKFFVRFLPEALAPVATISDDDIEVDSVVITCTETERLVTKFVAEWRVNQFQSQPDEVIFRYNVQKYGIQEERHNFYAYNQGAYVEQAAQFWMIRKSSTWKILQCKALLHKLQIETFDPVQVQFNENLVAIGPVTGIVQKATFNPDDDTIDLEIWLPVRLGEMEEYKYSYPFDKTHVYPNVEDPNIHTGNPYELAEGELQPTILFPPIQQVTYSTLNPWTQGRAAPIGDAYFQQPPGGVVVALAENNFSLTRPTGIETFNDEKKYTVADVTPYIINTPVPATFYGEVVARKEGNIYTVAIQFLGSNGVPKNVDVNIKQLDPAAVLPANYPLMVSRIVYMKGNPAVPTIEFVAQPPIWYPKSSGDVGAGGDFGP